MFEVIDAVLCWGLALRDCVCRDAVVIAADCDSLVALPKGSVQYATPTTDDRGESDTGRLAAVAGASALLFA